MNKTTKLIYTIAAFAVLMAAAVIGYRALSKGYQPGIREGERNPQAQQKAQAPDFTVYDENGNSVKLSDYKGVPVVLNFWASWCPPCKAEMPHFNKVSQEYDQKVLKFLIVDMVDGQRETAETGSAYVKAQGYTFPVFYDTDQSAAYQYGVTSIPRTYFIDKDGNIVSSVEGSMDEETLRDNITVLLDESNKEQAK